MSEQISRAGARAEAERLLDGDAGVTTALAQVLAAARGPATAGELALLGTALTTFADAQSAGRAATSVTRSARRRRGVLSAIAAAGLTTQIGIGVAAAAGVTGVVVAAVAHEQRETPTPPGTSTSTSSAVPGSRPGPSTSSPGIAPPAPAPARRSTTSAPGASTGP